MNTYRFLCFNLEFEVTGSALGTSDEERFKMSQNDPPIQIQDTIITVLTIGRSTYNWKFGTTQSQEQLYQLC